MKEWCIAHPYLTFTLLALIVIYIGESISDVAKIRRKK
jgi:ABC-type dipeptide/oligopeptide/nickel transport system permease subunit